MITTPTPPSRLVALFPHDDFLRPIRAYRSRLFASGYTGAHSFPPCIPLGFTEEPLKRDQLSNLAAHLRQRAEAGSGHFHLGKPGEPKLLGTTGFLHIPMRLNPLIHELPSDIHLDTLVEPDFILCLLSPQGSAMPPVRADKVDPGLLELNFPLRFRAAFVANLVLWPATYGVAGLSFCWERGNPVWLPAPLRRKTPK